MFENIKQVLAAKAYHEWDNPSAWDKRPDALHVAVVVLLLEVAYADEKLSSEDRSGIQGFIESRARLSEAATDELLQLADQVRKQSIELWQFTHLIAENFSLEQKLDLIEMMWRIIYDDGKLNMEEDNLVHKLSTLVGLRHSELIESKLKVLREQRRGRSESGSVSPSLGENPS